MPLVDMTHVFDMAGQSVLATQKLAAENKRLADENMRLKRMIITLRGMVEKYREAQITT